MTSVLADTDADGAEFLACLSRNSTRQRLSERSILRSVNTASNDARRVGHRSSNQFLRASFGLAIRALAAAMLLVLVLLEPLVQPLLCATALLAFAMAMFFRFLIGDAAFPFWGMLALSLICILLLSLYYGLVRLCLGH